MEVEKILAKIKALSPESKMNFRICNRKGNPYNGESKMYVRIDCNDCLERYEFKESEVNEGTHSKIIECLRVDDGKCVKNEIHNGKIEELYDILVDNGAGMISVNSYREGTCIEFMMDEYGYNELEEVEVTTPGVHTTTLQKGKEYYVCETKYTEEKFSLSPKKLLRIEMKYNNGFLLYFEGLKRPVETLVRAHVEETDKLVNRIDHTVIANVKSLFIGYVIKKLGMEYYTNQEETKDLLNQVISKI